MRKRHSKPSTEDQEALNYFARCVVTSRVTQELGLTRGQLRAAIESGLLRRGVHWMQPKGQHIRYFIDRLRPLRADIELAWSRASMLKDRKRELAARELGLEVSSERKRVLAEAIQQALDLEQELIERLEALIARRRRLQDKYFLTLWERKDCPICEGQGCAECRVKSPETQSSQATTRASSMPSDPPAPDDSSSRRE